MRPTAEGWAARAAFSGQQPAPGGWWHSAHLRTAGACAEPPLLPSMSFREGLRRGGVGRRADAALPLRPASVLRPLYLFPESGRPQKFRLTTCHVMARGGPLRPPKMGP